MLAGVMDALHAGHQLGQEGFVGAALAEILADGVDQGLLLLDQQLMHGLEPLAPLRSGRHGVGCERLALGCE
ncbi:hypothetical protein D3C80_1062090 [compost metagenome]